MRFPALLAVGALTLVPATAWAQSLPQFKDVKPAPDTPAFRRAREVADAVNSGDLARLRALVENAFAPDFRKSVSMEDHLAVLAGWREANQGLEVYAGRTYDPPRPETSAVLIVRSRLLEAWRAVSVEVEPQPPHRITSLSLDRARTPKDIPAAPALDPAAVAKSLGEFVDRLAKADQFSGTVLLAKDGKVLLTRAVGVANRDFDAPVRIDTRFNLGSMNKMFTGVSIMKLVEAGRLSLDDPISKYLDATWIPKVDKTKVKVVHLLTHTSGLGSYFNDVYDRSSRLLFRRVDDYKPLVVDETLAFEPGTRWAYSNTGMLLAGAVIEKASGMDYFDYVRKNVYGPAGMTGSDCYELDRVNPNLAVGYERQPGPNGPVLRNNIFDHVLRGGPAGGGYSTVEDLNRFAEANRARRLLGDAATKALWTPRPEIASPEYGLGFFVDTTPLGPRVGHSGGFTGLSAQLDVFLDAGWNIAVMSNLGQAAATVAEKANGLILQGR
ncbi:MAG TPA: serine hydrolase domain-containing protein [Candidatus Polarisedimenticolia bacterium]|nr:serine hydrolase domain-containing protein [Candidatus Polarisedimenticolia bacterium]